MIFIKNGQIKPIVGEDFVGNILVQDGKIAALGADVVAPEGAEIIDATGCLVTPGIVDGHSHLGLVLESIRFEGQNGNEACEPITPQVRAIDGFNPQSECLMEAVNAGVTTVCICPGSANVIGGSCSVVKLQGDCVDDMVIRADMAMKCAFGENPKFCYGKDNKAPVTRMGQVALMREMFFKALEYSEAKKAGENDPSKMPKYDQKLEALVPVVRKEIPIKVHAHRKEDIFNAIRVAKEFGLEFTIEHCTEGWMVPEEMAKEGVRAFVGPLTRSKGKYETRNLSESNPTILHQAGVKFGLTVDAPVIPACELLIMAGLICRKGLGEDATWRALTIDPAEIIGVSHRVGSLEVGKDADIAIYCGNPLKEISAHTKQVLINGKKMK